MSVANDYMMTTFSLQQTIGFKGIKLEGLFMEFGHCVQLFLSWVNWDFFNSQCLDTR